MDWSHPSEAYIQHHKGSPHLEPSGEEEEGLTKKYVCCDLEVDMRRNGYMWGELQRLAQDRDDWRVLIGGLCSRWGYRQ